MSHLLDHNNTNEDDNFIVFVVNSALFGEETFFVSQTFTPIQNYELSSIKLLLSREIVGGALVDPGTIKCEVYNTDENGKPTGSAVISSTTNANTLPVFSGVGDPENDDPYYEWREFTFISNPNLVEGTKYAIVLSMDGDTSVGTVRQIFWWVSGDQYARGNYQSALLDYPPDPDPEDWSDVVTRDNMFEVYGITADEVTPFPQPRPDDYQPDAEWDPNGGGEGDGDWTTEPWDLTTLGGGRYGKQLVVVGHRRIYYGDL